MYLRLSRSFSVSYSSVTTVLSALSLSIGFAGQTIVRRRARDHQAYVRTYVTDEEGRKEGERGRSID